MVEYLASFWNSEAVEKIRMSRDTKNNDRFESDEEFNKKIEDGQIISDEVLDILRNKYENTNYNTNNSNGDRRRLPSDISGLSKIIKK
tara:strand:+ start:1476 stop:1739 length:264 start_codon:yes stop_codon:yes gene_type:complete